MSAFIKLNYFVQDVGDGLHNLNSDALYVMLTNVAPVAATSHVYSDLTDLSTANGYTAGGKVSSGTAYSQSSGTATLSGGNVVFTASGGSIGPFRYVPIYNHTASSKNIIGYWDYGSSISITDGNTFTVDLSSNILTLA